MTRQLRAPPFLRVPFATFLTGRDAATSDGAAGKQTTFQCGGVLLVAAVVAFLGDLSAIGTTMLAHFIFSYPMALLCVKCRLLPCPDMHIFSTLSSFILGTNVFKLSGLKASATRTDVDLSITN